MTLTLRRFKTFLQAIAATTRSTNYESVDSSRNGRDSDMVKVCPQNKTAHKLNVISYLTFLQSMHNVN